MVAKQSSNRDDFSLTTIKLLRDRAGNLCSNPDCRVVTGGANSNPTKTSSIGVAAHITAAASGRGAARYDSSLLPEQRKHYDNGIWLCQSCSRLIDVDEEKFPVSLLKEWKLKAEQNSANNIGKKLITKEESEQNAMEQVVRHIFGQEPANIFDGIEECVQHFDKKLQRLDPRFDIRTEIADGNVKRTLVPNSELKFNVTIGGESAKQFKGEYDKLIKFGDSVEIPTENLSISGSNLLEAIADSSLQGGRFILKGRRQKVNLELFVANTDCSVSLGGFKGEMVMGTERITIQGSALKGFIKFNWEHNKNEGIAVSNYQFDTKVWFDTDILKIPFFPRLKKALPYLMDGAHLIVELTDKDYRTVEIGNSSYINDQSQIEQVTWLISYFNYAREISEKFNTKIIYKSSADMSNAEYDFLQELCELINSSIVIHPKGDDIKAKFAMSLYYDNKTLFPVPFDKPFEDFTWSEHNLNFRVLGSDIVIPEIQHSFSNAKHELLSGPIFDGEKYNLVLTIRFGENARYEKSLVLY